MLAVGSLLLVGAVGIAAFYGAAVIAALLAAGWILVAGLLLWRCPADVVAPSVPWRDVMPCYLSVQGPDLRIREVNELFREQIGTGVGLFCFKAYKQREAPCPDCPVLRTFADGKVHSSEETVVDKRGKVTEVLVTSAPFEVREGKVTAVVEMSTNVTQVKDLQRQLALVGLAVSGMAHRIKNVMMGLEGGVFVVNTGMEGNDAEALRRGWEMVQRNAQKISRIARDLLFCSKEHEPHPVAGVSPKAIVAEVAAGYVERAKQEAIALRVELGEEDDTGTFDPEAVHNVVANLVTNAIDACRFDAEGKEKQHAIIVRARREPNGGVLIEVEDNGAGISREDSEKVFDSFFSTKGAEGTGLGLLVVQKVAREHQGDVTFDSTLGRGTCFRVRLRSLPAGA